MITMAHVNFLQEIERGLKINVAHMNSHHEN